jgi:hypothetical protein
MIGLHVDIDFKDIDDTPEDIDRKLGNLQFPPSRIHASGNGRHCFWLFKEAIRAGPDMERVESALKLICDLVGGDQVVAQCVALMRLPGTHNTKFGRWAEVTTIANSGTRDELDDLEEWLAETSPVILRKVRPAEVFDNNHFLAAAKANGFKPSIDVEKRLAGMSYMSGGDAAIHSTQLAVSASLLRGGTTTDDAVRLILAATKGAAGAYGERWNWGREEKAIRKMCSDWLRKHPVTPERQAEAKAADQTKSQPIEIFWHGTEYNRAARLWLVKELIPESGAGLASGQWGTAKTFAMLDLAASIMTGTPFAGREVNRRGGVLFIAAEGANEIPIRLQGVVEQKLKPAASGGMSIYQTTEKGGSRVACSAAKQNKGCAHRKSCYLSGLETVVLDGMKDNMTDPKVLIEYTKSYHARWAERQKEISSERSTTEKALDRITGQIDRYVVALGESDQPVRAVMGKA